VANDDNAQVEAQIERALDAGDLGGAAEAIVRRYGVEVMSYLVAVTRDRQAADDVFSTTCEDLWRGLAGFQRRSSVRTWLYRLAWHAMLRHRNDAFARRRAPLSRQLKSWAAPIRSRKPAGRCR
jgi:RNA polymerase sigma-70 factor (ECF subfamily)